MATISYDTYQPSRTLQLIPTAAEVTANSLTVDLAAKEFSDPTINPNLVLNFQIVSSALVEKTSDFAYSYNSATGVLTIAGNGTTSILATGDIVTLDLILLP